ncbi:MAG: hypothetical protein AAFX04_09795 [Pseudomonadota bacterium]
MTDAVSGTAGRLRFWVILVLCLLLAALVVAVQLGEAAAGNRQWQTGLLFPTSDGEAAARLSSDLLAADEKQSAGAFAMDALDDSLTHVEALRTLGITRFDEGEEDKGKKLVELAGQLSWRDSATQAWLFEQSLRDGDYARSIQHADALLRRRRVQSEIFSIFTLAALDPELSGTVRQQFIANPPWRANFFADADDTDPSQYRGFENIAIGLKNTESPVTPREALPFINMLVQKGETGRALQTWANLFPSQSAVLPANGSITLAWPRGERMNLPYPTDWRFRSSRSILPLVRGAGDDSDTRLDLELDRRALGPIAEHLVMLPPGEITLQLDTDALARRDLGKLRWYLQCTDTPRNRAPEIALVPERLDTPRWQTVLGEQDCPVYRLVMAVRLGGLSAAGDISLGAVRLSHKRPEA